jgi:hypothetical protein
LKDAVQARTNAQARLTQLMDHPSRGGWHLNGEDVRVRTQQKLVAALTDAAARLQALTDSRTIAWRATTAALSSVESWLNGGKPAGTMLEPIEVEPPKLNKGESGLLDAVENRRRKARELRDELDRIEAAKFPSAHAKQRARQQIEQLAESGRPDVAPLILFDQDIAWPMRLTRSVVHGDQRQLAFAEINDALALTANSRAIVTP